MQLKLGIPRLAPRYLLLPLSALVGALSFPGPNQGWLAWLSLIPLLAFGEQVRDRREFLWGVFISEMLKWLWLVIWLRHVSWIPTVGIALVMALYHMIWYRIYWGVRSIVQSDRRVSAIVAVIALGLGWALLEWARTKPFGMPGNPLNVTQWQYPGVLAICSVIGGYGLSAAIVTVNLSVFSWVVVWAKGGWSSRGLFNRWWITAMVVILPIVIFGVWSRGLRGDQQEGLKMKVAFVQPYQPPYRYWTRDRMVGTVETVFKITGSCSDSDFDLMLWPEGTLPLPIYDDSDMDWEVSHLVSKRVRRPLLLGNQFNLDDRSYNAVLAYGANGELSDAYYAKNYLVPFGEFVPWRAVFGFLNTIVPLPDDFEAGTEAAIIPMEVANRNINISALVCYEDCFPDLAVGAARNGANAVYVATYDVWYGKELAAYMHAAHAVVRAAETGLPFLRCGSGGWSGFINGGGEIQGVIRDETTGSIYFRGYDILEVEIPTSPKQTIFVRYYEAIVVAIAIATVGLFFLLGWIDRSRTKDLGV